jgi:hypothetical protein
MIQEGAILIPFRYAAGQAGSRFLVALRDEMRVLGSRCRQCGRVAVPIRPFCPACGRDDLVDTEVGPLGTLVSWTETPDQRCYALVRLDGSDTPLLHRLLPASGGRTTGQRVRLRFADSRSGSILDIEGFEPMTGGQP